MLQRLDFPGEGENSAAAGFFTGVVCIKIYSNNIQKHTLCPGARLCVSLIETHQMVVLHSCVLSPGKTDHFQFLLVGLWLQQHKLIIHIWSDLSSDNVNHPLGAPRPSNVLLVMLVFHPQCITILNTPQGGDVDW